MSFIIKDFFDVPVFIEEIVIRKLTRLDLVID
jgi:hypothetical protein